MTSACYVKNKNTQELAFINSAILCSSSKSDWMGDDKSNRSQKILEQLFCSDTTSLTLIKQPSTVRTQTLVMIPLCVPALSWCHTTTLAPDACHTHLKKQTKKKQSTFPL